MFAVDLTDDEFKTLFARASLYLVRNDDDDHDDDDDDDDDN